jgi:hypothetical protein
VVGVSGVSKRLLFIKCVFIEHQALHEEFLSQGCINGISDKDLEQEAVRP